MRVAIVGAAILPGSAAPAWAADRLASGEDSLAASGMLATAALVAFGLAGKPGGGLAPTHLAPRL